jgi:DNA invertase Pin-like site-specific DNA recombinase
VAFPVHGQSFPYRVNVTVYFKYHEGGGYVTVVRYHRVSTENQNLARQASATEDYVAETFPDADVKNLADADTGIDTHPDGYERLVDAIEDGKVDAVVVKDMSRIARSVRDLMRYVDRLREAGVELHSIEDP